MQQNKVDTIEESKLSNIEPEKPTEAKEEKNQNI